MNLFYRNIYTKYVPTKDLNYTGRAEIRITRAISCNNSTAW